jgi:hypothetical protein
LHVPRQELERKFEIVLLLENDRMELKSSAKDSYDLRHKAAQFLIAIQAELMVRLPFSARTWKTIQESSAGHQSSTYKVVGSVGNESAGVDLDICTTDIDCSALEVPCSPPGHT